MEQSFGLDNQQERRETAIRLAAFFEGEGSFIVTYQELKNGWVRCCPVIRMGNCDPDAIKEMQRILDIHGVGSYVYLQKKYKPGHAQCAVLSINGFKRIAKFLAIFGDYFFARKRNNILLWKKYIPFLIQLPHSNHSFPEERQIWRAKAKEFVEANKELNRLGVSRFLIDYTPNALTAKI